MKVFYPITLLFIISAYYEITYLQQCKEGSNKIKNPMTKCIIYTEKEMRIDDFQIKNGEKFVIKKFVYRKNNPEKRYYLGNVDKMMEDKIINCYDNNGKGLSILGI